MLYSDMTSTYQQSPHKKRDVHDFFHETPGSAVPLLQPLY